MIKLHAGHAIRRTHHLRGQFDRGGLDLIVVQEPRGEVFTGILRLSTALSALFLQMTAVLRASFAANCASSA